MFTYLHNIVIRNVPRLRYKMACASTFDQRVSDIGRYASLSTRLVALSLWVLTSRIVRHE